MDRTRRRGALALVIAAVTLLAGLAQTAEAAQGPKSSPQGTPPGLLEKAKAKPQQTFRVIIRGARGVPSSGVAAAFDAASHGQIGHMFSSINGVSATINGAELTALSHNPNILSIVADSPVALVGIEESTLWRAATGANKVTSLLGVTGRANLPAIAIVDSGIDASKSQDFGSRIVANVNLNADDPSVVRRRRGARDDGRRHCGRRLAALSGRRPDGADRRIRTADANGASHMSDVIAACDWILQNASTYNIRVANFSLVSEAQSSFVNDPLDAAVEQLWYHGIVVVAASGNFGQPGGVLMAHAPGNDPFVITVGALDTNGTDVDGRRFRRTVVCIRPHGRRLREAGDLRSRPLDRRAGSGRIDPRDHGARPCRRARVHVDVGNVARGPDGRRRSRRHTRRCIPTGRPAR